MTSLNDFIKQEEQKMTWLDKWTGFNTNIKFLCIIVALFLFACMQTNDQLINEGQRLIQQEKYEDAIAIYTRVIMRNNKLQNAYYGRGIAYASLKQYGKALWDFNKTISLQFHDGFMITYNKDFPFATKEAKAPISYYDVLYQRAQVRLNMNSLDSSFNDFQILIANNYSEKSNCLLWQGTIYFKSGQSDKACAYFEDAKAAATTREDSTDADDMIKRYCKKAGKTE